jgi:hypothetical protein
MPEEQLRLRLQLEPPPESDARETDALARRLQHELLQLDVDSVHPLAQGPAPDGARAIEVMALGALVASMARSPELLKTVCSTVQAWVSTSHARSVELQLDGDSIKLSGVSSAEQQRLIQLFIDRHTR